MSVKLGHILLSIVLIVSTVGVVISKHYCGDNLVSISIDYPADPCCEDMNGECCHDEEETLILETEYIFPEIEENQIAEIILINRVFCDTPNESLSSYNTAFLLSEPPPLIKFVSLANIQAFLL
jgi:hypothetical protein